MRSAILLSCVAAGVLFSSAAAAGAAPRVAICHVGDDGAFHAITVNENAVHSHVSNHGDVLQGTFFPDADGDGHGDPEGAPVECPFDGYVASFDDCDDARADVYPGAPDAAGDGLDADCGTSGLDLDDDGYDSDEDCNDVDASIHPGAEDTCGNATDDDCNGQVDETCPVAECPCFDLDDIRTHYAEFQAAVSAGEIVPGDYGCYSYVVQEGENSTEYTLLHTYGSSGAYEEVGRFGNFLVDYADGLDNAWCLAVSTTTLGTSLNETADHLDPLEAAACESVLQAAGTEFFGACEDLRPLP